MILVTGGNGFVGRTLIRCLLERGHDVWVAETCRQGPRAVAEHPKLTWAEVDIRDEEATTQLISDCGPDVIFHLAAIHYIPECEQVPAEAIATNITGTLNLVNGCPPNCRFVFTSSGAVYAPDDQPHEEYRSRIAPQDVYGHTKYVGERLTADYAARNGFPAIIVRLFNVIGPGEMTPHVLPEIVAQLRAGRTTLELGDLRPKRNYIYVEDVARGFMAVGLHGDVPAGEAPIVNLGTDQQYSVEELLNRLRMITEIDIQVKQATERMRKTDRPFLLPDTTRIEQLFGWQSQVTIDEALERIWEDPQLSDALMERYR